MTRVGVVTQARTTSTRLPGKVLADLGGRSVLDRHLDRLLAAGLDVLVATTGNATDDPVADLARRRGLHCHRGSESDVLARFDGCARAHDLDVVVRVTSDCPLLDGDLVADGVRTWLAADDPWLYLSNGLRRTFPRGFDFEVFSAEALHDAAAHAVSPAEREHVTPYLYRDHPRVRLAHVTRPVDASHHRVTVDTAADLTVVRRLVTEHRAHELDVDRIVSVLDAHPELTALNADVVQKRLEETV